MDTKKSNSPEVAKAALILSREHLENEDVARAAIGKLADGEALYLLAMEMFSLPMVAKHLRQLSPPWFDAAKVKPLEMQFALSHMVLRAEQQAFYEKCIKPVNQGHAFIKGFALADQFYDEPNIRFARDIDVLVRRHSIVPIIEHALSQGYTMMDTIDYSKTLTSDQDIRAALRYQKVFSLISPKGWHIEVHREVDKEQGIFDERRLLYDTQEVLFDGGTFQTLNPVDHFIYVAYHSARHNWSKLHWSADLAAMARHPLISREALIERASEMGLGRLIEETLGYVALSADPDSAMPDAPGARILARALDIAQNGEHRAVEFANQQSSTALPFPDMLAPWLRKRVRARRLWGRLKPHISDYQTWPLPERWQWVYWLAGPTRRVLRKKSP